MNKSIKYMIPGNIHKIKLSIDPRWFKSWMNAIKRLGKDAVLVGLFDLGIEIINLDEMGQKEISEEALIWSEEELKKFKKSFTQQKGG